MFRIAICVLLVASTAHAADYSRTLTVSGKQRTYQLHVPSFRQPGTALVIAYHGTGMTAGTMAGLSGLTSKSNSSGFVVAYPTGIGGKFNDATDVAFARAIVNDVQSIVATDPKRTFATGMSNGAIFCYKLAAQASDLVAAIAPVAGTMLTKPGILSAPVSVIHFHGTADSLIPYNGGNGMPSATLTTQTWAKADQCSLTPVTIQMPDTASDGTTVSRKTYDASSGAEVILYTISGGGHTWPGMRTNPAYLGTTTYDIKATDLIWDFFQKHPKR